jgi:hypothetical protein
VGLFLPKIILLSGIGMRVKHVFFCSYDETIKYVFQYNFAHSNGQSSKQLQACIQQIVLSMSLKIGYMVSITSSKLFLGWE